MSISIKNQLILGLIALGLVFGLILAQRIHADWIFDSDSPDIFPAASFTGVVGVNTIIYNATGRDLTTNFSGSATFEYAIGTPASDPSMSGTSAPPATGCSSPLTIVPCKLTVVAPVGAPSLTVNSPATTVTAAAQPAIVAYVRVQTDAAGNLGTWSARRLDNFSALGSIFGAKVLLPGNQAIPPASTQIVSLDGGVQTDASEPYQFLNVAIPAGGTHTVSVPNIAGFTTGFNVCYNNNGCINNPPTPGNSTVVSNNSIGAGGYATVWWYYTSINPPYINVNNGDVHSNSNIRGN